MQHSYLIREAEESDIPALLEMGRRFADECGLHHIAPYDGDSMAATFRHLIADPNGILLICDGGAAGALTHPAYWNHSHITGQELFWWVDPGKRGCGLALFDALEEAARAMAGSFTMITLDAIRPELTGKFYERRGYRPIERTFTKVFN